jgi:hypothetical protein
MRKLLLSAAAGIVGLALTGAAEAHPGVGGHARPPVAARAHYQDHGVRFAGGVYYRGRDHHHWTRCVWDSVHHRYQYWDPSLQVYYYWSPATQCYYPVNYCP